MLINQAATACRVFHASNFQPQQQRIIDEMAQFGRNTNFTIAELATYCHMEKSSVSARRRAMLDAGILELGAERKCSISGKTVQTVHLKTDLLGRAA